MIRTLTKRTTPPGPAEPLAEDHLQLLKRARSEECKAEDAGKEGPEGEGDAAAPTAGMIASIMVADMPKAGPPRVLPPEIATLASTSTRAEAEVMSLKRNDSMVFSESTRTERAGESDASERSEHEGSDDDDEAGGSPEGTSPGAARPPAGVSPEEGEAGAALLLSLTDPASLLLGLQRGAPPDCPAVGPPRKTEAAAPGSTPQKRRGVADRASHFYCKHPDCGKSYGCPDAVRKHCRKKHPEWLRRLGASTGPAGYCRWD